MQWEGACQRRQPASSGYSKTVARCENEWVTGLDSSRPEAANHVNVTMRDFSRSLIPYAHCRSRPLPAKRGRC